MGSDQEHRESELLAEFTRRAAALGVVVARHAGSDGLARAIAAYALEVQASDVLVAAELAAAAPALSRSLSAGQLSWSVPEEPGQTRDARLGVSLGLAAVAETGSVLLAEESLPDRGIGMLAAVQVIVCPAGWLVPSLDQAVPLLRALALKPGGAYVTLVTGPSRTADIERVLTVGVQGPGRVIVLFVDELT
ncbi:MAG: lactate utilization protein [Chloroflexota bacterium]|nr:lactate utilization protein [Chloroflexota bacterium]